MNIHTVIIGAGQAGLALSRCLTERGVEHVLLERGRVAQRWSERWDSLRLLTPNWMTRLPRWSYRGPQPNGFLRRNDVVRFLRDYAVSFDAPVEEDTTVLSVRTVNGKWHVATTRGNWRADNVVIATGHCDKARVPDCELPPHVQQLTTQTYRNPSSVQDGRVLVVGASASGVQLARELRRAGHDVVIAVGRHSRMPRRYRGRDIHYWLDRVGLMTRALSDVRDTDYARHEPSLQLIGGDRNLDLHELASMGVQLAGHLTSLDATRAHFAGDLPLSVGDADRRLRSVLAKIDRHIAGHGAGRRFPADAPPAAVPVDDAPRSVELHDIRTVLWATGYQRSYPWLHAPVLDAQGEIRHRRGRTPLPGLYVLGLQFMTRRNSALLDGVGRDAEELAEAIAPVARREAA
ncbi:MAG TPA: NAD(P)-binding domain-containing protein [Thermoanaerobaculia bacterium]